VPAGRCQTDGRGTRSSERAAARGRPEGRRSGTERAAVAGRIAAAIITAAWALVAATAGVRAQTAEVRVVRTDTPPTIDGRLDEEAWRDAAVIRDLTQVEPAEGRPPSQATQVYLLYDRDFLFIGVRARDSQPDRIIARDMERDSAFRSDDHIAFVIDTFLDRRNGFLFRVNPLGAQADGLVENSRDIGDDWDGIWYADARIDEAGWVAEIALPFKTVAFDPAGNAWGFNIERVIRRNNELVRWTAADQDRELTAMGRAGRIVGISDVRQGIGLDVKPAAVVRAFEQFAGGPAVEVEPSLDVTYRITPSLASVLTFNTDFAETEVDERRINLDRFDLFFPEKRDFFLEDAGIFEFGDLEQNGRPFFSRRIGLDDDGAVVDLIAGGKLTGRQGPANLGFLGVRTGETAQVDAKNLFVGRTSFNILEQSSAGFIVTHGNPTGPESNTVIGTDFSFRTDRLFGTDPLTATLWAQRAFTEGVDGREWAYGGRLEYPADRLALDLEFKELQENFRPRLGFVNRRNIRQLDAAARFRFRFAEDSLFRKLDTGAETTFVANALDNTLETNETKVDLAKLETDIGDEVSASYKFQYEALDEDFEIVDGIVIPEDVYQFHRVAVAGSLAPARPLAGGLEIEGGQFFDGHSVQSKPFIEWRPSPHFFVSFEYERNDVFLPDGNFNTNLARSRIVVQFSPSLIWQNLIQYDDVSDSVGINSRLRWIVAPDNETFLVFNRLIDTAGGTIDPQIDRDTETRTEAVAKVVWTFRF